MNMTNIQRYRNTNMNKGKIMNRNKNKTAKISNHTKVFGVGVGVGVVIVKYFKTYASQERGLMFRKTILGENCGALFSGGPFTGVWMKNTYIPLEAIVIDSNNVVVETVSNMTPLSESVHFFRSTPVHRFIEVDKGFIEKNKIRRGMKLHFKF
jgi:uncharacterized membrane protein (UPF0127 family)